MSMLTETVPTEAAPPAVSTPTPAAGEMTGLRKAAIVLLNMDREASAEVLRHLGEARAEMLAAIKGGTGFTDELKSKLHKFALAEAI